MNTETHNFSTRNNSNPHPPITNLAKFKKGAYNSGIKNFIYPHPT